MLEIDGIIDVYFDERIHIAVGSPGELDEARVKTILTEREIAFSKIERTPG